MKSNAKRLWALVIAAVMVLSMLPVMALASDTEQVIAEGSASFATDSAAFDGEAVTFTPETGGDVTVEITACDPGYYVDVYADGEWIVDYCGSAADSVSFTVNAGSAYEILICSYTVYSESLKFATAGSVSYKVTFVSNGETGSTEEPTVPEDVTGDSQDNPKVITGAEWTFIGGGQTIWYLYDNYQNMIENGVYSMMLHVNSSADYSVTYRGQDVPVDENGFVNYEMVDMTYQGQYLFSVTNNSTEEAFFGIEVKERPQYVNTGKTLHLGGNNITLDTSAVFSLYEFSPSQTGIYQITVAQGVVGDWGTSFNPTDNTPEKTNTLVWTCTAVGQSVMVGFTGAQTTVATVVRTGDYVAPENIPWVIYENTYDFSYEVPEGETVDIALTDGGTHTAVLGSDGFYHYGSACGPLMVADLSTAEINLKDAYNNGGLRAWILDENKQTVSKTDYNEALIQYYEAGLVPVTQELAMMLQELGEANGWWDKGGFVFGATLPADMSTAWMELCAYLEGSHGHSYEDGVCTGCGEADPNAGVTVSGTVESANDGDATVELWSDGAVAYTATVTDGSYSFGNVAPGSYTLTVSKENHVSREYAVSVEGDAVTQDVKICLIGDVTGDGRVNIGDVAKVYAHVRGTALLTDEYQLACANVNGGSLNIGDVAALYSHVKGSKLLY